ncbi:unnamed protein product [Paramecium primaurelia]|uniref:Ku domain-containing protein n=1 Tax=Paramecium primaurelia TaxID=5886 RepID=A0A8S1PTA5_PARPR|nr:unnamed protein product [Paramecium primaurelia]
MTPIEIENIIKCYQYGRNLLPFDSLREKRMKYQCSRSLQLFYFINKSQISGHYLDSSLIIKNYFSTFINCFNIKIKQKYKPLLQQLIVKSLGNHQLLLYQMILKDLIRKKTYPKLVIQSLFKINQQKQNNYQK